MLLFVIFDCRINGAPGRFIEEESNGLLLVPDPDVPYVKEDLCRINISGRYTFIMRYVCLFFCAFFGKIQLVFKKFIWSKP